MFGIENSRTVDDLKRYLSLAFRSITSRLTALENSGNGADPQTATNTANIATNTADITAINAQLPPPLTSITGLGDFIKVGSDSRNSDSAYTVSFDTPFVSGSDSDISVVINRQASNTGNCLLAINITKSGFQIDRDNAIDGTQTINYIAVNGSYL